MSVQNQQLRRAREEEAGMRHPLLPYAPHLFFAATALAAASLDWPRRWIVSGAPILTYSWLLGAANGYRVLPFVPLWTLIATLNLIYAVAATSWLLYWCFLAACYPAIFASCLFQFDAVADVVRKQLRAILRQFHFIDDKIAFFNLPALEIDTDVDGLMVVRGISISLSTLTIVAHGVQVVIKLSDDMELALRTDHVTISILRKIDIGNVYGNLKGGQFEMSFGHLAKDSNDADAHSIMVTNTPMLKQAAASARSPDSQTVKTTEQMTTGTPPRQSPVKDGLKSTQFVYLSDQQAIDNYQDSLCRIDDTSDILQSQQAVEKVLWNTDETKAKSTIKSQGNDMLAAVCSALHNKPSMSHPSVQSIKVTTLQNLVPGYMRKFLHRLPMLYRMLLNPLSYFHPVKIASVTASASGKWIQAMLDRHMFHSHPETNPDTEHLQNRISEWLSDANFVLGLNTISASAHVPFLPDFNISNHFSLSDAMVYRTSAAELDLKQVARIGGADANIEIPSFLLPHHEHLLPPQPTNDSEKRQEAILDEVEGKPNVIQAQTDLDQMRKDETNMKISVHACLPVVIDQELLDFTIALVKASKLVELENIPSSLDNEVHSFKDFSKAVGSSIRDNLRKTTVDAFANDKWIAKLVGKIIKKLETAEGDVGYSGNVAIPLKPYRDQAESATKFMA